MALFGGGLLGQQQPGLLGGQQPVLPRVPWNQNPMITMAGMSLLGGRNLNEGLSNVAANAPAGMAAKSGMQQFMLAQQERDRERSEADARKAQMNEVMKAWPGLSPEQRALFSAQPELFGQYAVGTMTPPKPTDDISEYNFAKSQGFNGTFQDYQIAMKKAGASNVNVDNVGSIPQGYELYTDPETGAKRMQVIPGGPAAISEKSASQVEQAGAESQAVKAETMLDATASIKEEMKTAKTPTTGTMSRPFSLLSSTSAGRIRSYVGSLKSGVALQAILKLKEASATGATGFGALSAPELQLLVDDIGSLDPDNTEPDIFLKSIERIEQRWKNVLQDVRRTVPPERLAEMGIDINSLIDGMSDGDGWTEVEPGVRIREMP